MSNKKILQYAFPLRREEAEALYNTSFDITCPLKMHVSARKVWWVISSQGQLPYTLCQECYHNNRFGLKTSEIKESLEPIILGGIPCNCDGRSIEESYPIILPNGWKLGIYSITPKVGLLNATLYDMDKKIHVEMPFLKCNYSICLYKARDMKDPKSTAIINVQSNISNVKSGYDNGKGLLETWTATENSFQMTINKMIRINSALAGSTNIISSTPLGIPNLLNNHESIDLEYSNPKTNGVESVSNSVRVRICLIADDHKGFVEMPFDKSNEINDMMEYDPEVDIHIVFDNFSIDDLITTDEEFQEIIEI
jgi:hypothetical protein